MSLEGNVETIFDKAVAEDYGEVIDFANYVFSHAYRPFDFPSLLPKLLKFERFMDGAHYLAREAESPGLPRKIKAVVGAYPLEIKLSCGAGENISLPGCGVGMVSVHPYSRSKGYMKILMKAAVEEMRRDGAVFSCLGGDRQRYEYFGFTPAGSTYAFDVKEHNTAHVLGREWETGLSLEKIGADACARLDQIHAMHEAKGARLHRGRDRLFDILSSWRAETFAVTEGGRFEGYFVYHEKRSSITEIYLNDISRLPEVLGLFLREMGTWRVKVCVCPHEREKIAILSRLADEYAQKNAFQFAVFDHARFADAFIRFKAGREKIREGSFVFQVTDAELGVNSRVRLFAGKDGVGAEECSPASGQAPALTMGSVEATRFLSCPAAALSHPAIRESEFLRDVLPLPLFLENADEV